MSATTTPAAPPRTGRLQLTDICKRYGDVDAVRDVSVEIASGEFLTLLGPSGSGKTTTLNVIAGFVKPDSGEVRLDDRAITALPPHRRDIGMVFQNYALFPHMTAAANVAFPLEVRRVSSADRRARVNAALATVRLDGLGDRRPRQLSGGQQQRVALARAIVSEPPVLLMDEPMGALDKKLREALQLEIMRIHREVGVTVVYVTHDQEEALALSDRIAIYDSGCICQIGTAEELYERPESVYVADFMGESNIFRGTYEVGRDGARLLHDGRPMLIPEAGSATLGHGDRAAVVVRPERMRLDLADGATETSGRNALEGRVRDVVYLGSSRKYLIHLESGTLCQVRIASPADEAAIARDDEVRLSWHCEESTLLPDPEKVG